MRFFAFYDPRPGPDGTCGVPHLKATPAANIVEHPTYGFVRVIQRAGVTRHTPLGPCIVEAELPFVDRGDGILEPPDASLYLRASEVEESEHQSMRTTPMSFPNRGGVDAQGRAVGSALDDPEGLRFRVDPADPPRKGRGKRPATLIAPLPRRNP